MSSPAEEEGVPPEDVGAAAMPPGVAAALRAMNERVAATEQRLAATEAKVQELELELAALRDGVGGDDDDAAAPAPPAEPLMRDGREPPAGYTPGDLRQAAQGGDTKTLRELLEAGVNPMASQEMLAEWPPLHYAAQAGRLDLVELLLSHGARLDWVDKDGTTATMQAARWAHTELVERLVEHRGVPRRSVPHAVVEHAAAPLPELRWTDAGHVSLLCSAPE